MKDRVAKLFQEAKQAFRTPSGKQKEAFGRFTHTLSAASLIGSVSVLFTETKAKPEVFFKIGALIFWGMLLFLIGAILSKGE